MKFLTRLIPLSVFFPMLAFAQQEGRLTEVSGFINNIVAFINGTIVPLIFALAFLAFLWGMFQTFILGGSDEGKQAEGKQIMMYSIAGFVVMVSLWGIVNLVAKGFGFQNQNIQNIPDLPTVNN